MTRSDSCWAVRLLPPPHSTYVVVHLDGGEKVLDGDLLFITRVAAQAEASARNEFAQLKREVRTVEDSD